jgi:hypothetical protein
VRQGRRSEGITRGTSFLVVMGVAGLVALGSSTGSQAYPRCFGAASRAPVRPCHNPRLRLLVVPTPSQAQITPSSPCALVPHDAPPEVCAFGVPRSRAVKTFALIGDSHAVHWRAALEVVARAKRWRGLSLYRTQCPLSMAVPLQRKTMRAGCIRWRREVLGWVAVHPEIDTIVVSEHIGGSVRAAAGERQFAAKVRGYVDAWNALPASVAHIIVIRDVPYSETGTLACVARAMKRRKPAGQACALPRRTSLRPDPAVAAADQLHSPRVQAIDMTHFMCDRSRCFPVVGGALVRKDHGHLTRVFATTLGPFLLREIDRLIADWRPG